MGYESLEVDLQKLNRDEKEVLRWIRNEIDELEFEEIEEDALSSIKRDLKLQKQVKGLLAETQHTENEIEELEIYIRLQEIIDSEQDAEERSLKDLKILLRELEKEEIENSRPSAPEAQKVHEHAEEVSRKLSNAYQRIIEEEKEALDSLRQRCKQKIVRDVEEEINRLKNRPTVFVEEKCLEKLLRKLKSNPYTETGGFMSVTMNKEGLAVEKLFHEPNMLEEINWNVENSEKTLSEKVRSNLPLADEVIEMAQRSDNPGEFIQEKKNEMYLPSKELSEMYRESNEEFITWHTHPAPSSREEKWSFLASYGASYGDIGGNKKIFGRGYNGYFYEIIGKAYLPEAEKAGEYDRRMSLIIPNRWRKDIDDKKDVEFLPLWVTRNGEPLDRKYVRKNYPLVIQYNKAVCRAESVNKGHYLGIFINDGYNRLDPKSEAKAVDREEVKLLDTLQQILLDIDIPTKEFI